VIGRVGKGERHARPGTNSEDSLRYRAVGGETPRGALRNVTPASHGGERERQGLSHRGGTQHTLRVGPSASGNCNAFKSLYFACSLVEADLVAVNIREADMNGSRSGPGPVGLAFGDGPS
jgi:hypothetical protein